MKRRIVLFLALSIMLASGAFAQVYMDSTHFNWSRIESAEPVAPLVTSDADNGDGAADGAMVLKTAANTPAMQGIQYQLGGTAALGQQLNLETKYYQIGASFVKFKMQVYNITDNVVLAQTADLTTATGVVGTGTLSYTFTSASVGDQITVRFLRSDDLNPVRSAGIDYLKINKGFAGMTPPVVAGHLVIDEENFNWSRIENANPVAAIVKNDQDNGDGLGDGALQIKGTANTPALQGIQYLLGGTPVEYEKLTLEIKYYANSTSYTNFRMQVYNVTDDAVLAETATLGVTGVAAGTVAPVLAASLTYYFTQASVGDQIAVRFVRKDDLNPVRVVAIDYLKVNSVFTNMLPICKPDFSFDLPLTTATPTEINDLETIRNSLFEQLYTAVPPTAEEVNAAMAQYDLLNIQASSTDITGTPVTTPNQFAFLATFARYLKFNPADTAVGHKASNAVWYLAKQNCNNTNAALTFYNFPRFSRPAIFLNDYLSPKVKALFGNTLSTETALFQYIFDANYDFATTTTKGAINTDVIYLDLDVLFAYADWFDTNDEKIRYLKTIKRFLERFVIHTNGKADGLKKDGSGYHHGSAYDGYMYAFSTAATVIKSLENTVFQIDLASYTRFRDAIYAQTIYSSDSGIIPLSMTGRNPQTRTTTLAPATLAKLAISGGKILGLSTADPILAGNYNRKYGVNSDFNLNTITPFEEGYIQFNYGNLGVYRKNNWVATSRGFSRELFGAEIYIKQNRFGRYQSYGTLDIAYPGNTVTGNGFDLVGWDWNFNPGATTIVLPWDSLGAEKSRVDELNTYSFAGSLVLKQAGKAVLSKTMGESGLFAMRFKERGDLGFGTTYGPPTHNATFEFTKTYFAIDDYIICLGSGIKNNDANHPTVTTLSQRLNNNSNDLFVNGAVKSSQNAESFTGSGPNWVLDNYKTGYYILPGSGTLKIRNSLQQSPYQNQEFPSDSLIATNGANQYRLAYLDHGTAPVDNAYQFVCLPASDTARMAQFSLSMQNEQTRPFTVHANTPAAQIIEHKSSKTWAYALPLANASIDSGIVASNDTPCLVMYRGVNNGYGQILLSISNPDMGVSPSTPKTVRLKLRYEWTVSGDPNATIVSADSTGTIIDFVLADGFPVEVALTAVCAPVQVSITDVYAMNPAVDLKNTIYLGYGPTSLTTTATATGAEGYTYSWNTGQQTQAISVSQAGTYTATVSYGGVCQATASVSMSVVDVRCGNDADKVMICHNNKTICVAAAAVQAHLGHGDSLGSCNAGARLGVSTDEEIKRASHIAVYPNPAPETFYVTMPKLEANAAITLYNARGEVVRTARFVSAKQEVSLKGLAAGVYLVNIRNGKQIIVRKIIKY
ncbi:polysaccharide lyase family 8 super-sandwich domain-containing protein [Dyadobacter jiangsuensis]